MDTPKIKCPKCGKIKARTMHHIWPRRFYEAEGSPILYICRACHDDLEKVIAEYERLPKEMYEQIAYHFLELI